MIEYGGNLIAVASYHIDHVREPGDKPYQLEYLRDLVTCESVDIVENHDDRFFTLAKCILNFLPDLLDTSVTAADGRSHDLQRGCRYSDRATDQWSDQRGYSEAVWSEQLSCRIAGQSREQSDQHDNELPDWTGCRAEGIADFLDASLNVAVLEFQFLDPR